MPKKKTAPVVALVSKKTSTLTQADMNEEGIKTQLTQNDVLEVVVEEKYQYWQQFFKNQAEKVRNFVENYNKMQKDIVFIAFIAFCKKNKINLPSVTDSSKYSFTNKTKGSSSNYLRYYLPTLNSYRGKETVISTYEGLYSLNSAFKNHDYEVSFIETTENSFVHTSTTTTVKFSVPISAFKELYSLEDEVKKSSSLVEGFVNENKDVDFSYNGMLRTIKSKFNKELIKTGSPKLSAKIKELFGITI